MRAVCIATLHYTDIICIILFAQREWAGGDQVSWVVARGLGGARIRVCLRMTLRAAYGWPIIIVGCIQGDTCRNRFGANCLYSPVKMSYISLHRLYIWCTTCSIAYRYILRLRNIVCSRIMRASYIIMYLWYDDVMLYKL